MKTLKLKKDVVEQLSSSQANNVVGGQRYTTDGRNYCYIFTEEFCEPLSHGQLSNCINSCVCAESFDTRCALSNNCVKTEVCLTPVTSNNCLIQSIAVC